MRTYTTREIAASQGWSCENVRRRAFVRRIMPSVEFVRGKPTQVWTDAQRKAILANAKEHARG